MEHSRGNHRSIPVEVEMRDVSTRPLSFYENESSNEESEQRVNSNNNVDKEEHPNRSQITFVNTTVPVNILAQDIAGKHTPTRNSLRHSRMIVLNKTGEVPVTAPITLQYNKLIRWLLMGILILGLSMCILSLWLLLWTPNLRSRDNPGWSGIPVLVSSFAGILFTSSIPNPKGYSGRKFGYWRKALKYISITISVVAAGTSVLTFAFALLHLLVLSWMTCAPPDNLVSTCLCNINNSTEETIFEKNYHYVDLSCGEVNTLLRGLIMFSCACSILVFFFELIYLYLHWVNRNIHMYTRIPANISALNTYRENR